MLRGRNKIVIALCLCLAPSAGWCEIYRWVDENGSVHFSDSVPPKASKLERHVLDKQGNLRDVLKRQRTVEELEQHRHRIEAMATESQRRSHQEEYDRYLWTTFASLSTLEALRDERLEARDQQIMNLQDELSDVERALARERARRAERVLAQQNMMRLLEDDIGEIKRRIETVKLARQQEFQGLNKDIARYEYLRLKRAVDGR